MSKINSEGSTSYQVRK